MWLVVVWFISIFLAAAVGGRRNAAGTGLLLGLLLGPLGVLLAFTLQGDRRPCPFCKELVSRKASKCPHCQSQLVDGWAKTA